MCPYTPTGCSGQRRRRGPHGVQKAQHEKALDTRRRTDDRMAKLDEEHVAPSNVAYFRDVYDHLVRISESIDANRDLLGSAMDAYLSSVSNRTNEIMKYLTIMSALFLPLSFVVGFLAGVFFMASTSRGGSCRPGAGGPASF